jgi:two-component sensor histidine kinase
VGAEVLGLLRVAIDGALERARLRREKEAAEAEVRAARDRFEALAAERAVLLREVNHRVGNSLALVASFLRMQGTTGEEAHVREALAAAQGRVLAVARVHKRLYTSDDVRSVALDQYLRALVADLEASAAAATRGWLSLDADPIMIGPDRAVAVGVIVSELVINATRHAYPSGEGSVRVALKRLGDGHTRLSVEDDGVGPPPPPAENAAGVGHLIIEAMADKLGAAITLDRTHRGTRVVVEFT